MNGNRVENHAALRNTLPMAALFCAIAAATPSVAQVPSAPKPEVPVSRAPADLSQAPNVRTNVNEVALDIVVHDKGRKLILDLKPEDLQVTDNETPVKLTGLRLVRENSKEAARRHTVTMVFDPFSGPMAKSARNAADKILKTLPTRDYSAAVLDIRGRLRLVQPFTEDRVLVGRALDVVTASDLVRMEATHSRDMVMTEKADEPRNKIVSEAERNLQSIVRTGVDLSGRHADPSERAYDKAIFAALQESQKSLQEKRGYLNLDGLLAVIHAQEKLGDRKALIYFTHNMVMDTAAKERLKGVTAEATRAGMTIYVVDLDAMNQARGFQLDNAHLNAKPAFNPGPIATSPYTTVTPMQQDSGAGIQGDPSAAGNVWGVKQDIQVMTDFHRMGPAFSPFADIQNPMAALAQDTGGIYIDAQNSMKKPLEQMVEDMGTYYEATYVPPIKEYDGGFRAIQVKPLRTGLRVQSKTGYYALAPGAEVGTKPFEVPLKKVLEEAALPSELKFRASVLRFGELPDGNTNTLAVEIPFSELQVKEDVHTNLFSAHASLLAQIKDATGAVIEHFSEDMTHRGALEARDRDRTSVLAFERHFIAMPGKYTLEIAVTDQLNGKKSAQRSEFEIPNETNGPAVSDMVLVRKMNPVREDEDDSLNPLRYERDRITPDISAQLPASAKGVSIFFLLHPAADAKEPATLEMEVSRNGAPGRRTPLPFSPNHAQSAAPYLASFGNGNLASGHYEVKAYLSQGGKTAVQTVAFNVGDGQTATALDEGSAKQASDAAIATLASTQPINIPGQLAITATRNAQPPPSRGEAQFLIEDARRRALNYTDSLPNFLCLQITNRSVDPSASGRWKLKDTIVEVLRYRDKHETRTVLEINGQKTSVEHEGIQGALSEGEFGGVLKAVFGQSSKADFRWKETAELQGGTVQVFDYTVDKANSSFGVVGTDNREIIAGFHGQVFLESATRSVRRISMVADLPKDFTTHASSISVDYDYVSINDHDYLMPVAAEMRLLKGKHAAVLNTIEFRNYKRFGSNMRILGVKPVDEKEQR